MDAIQAYRQSEIAGDNPVRLVILLYDQLLRDLHRALEAFAKGDIPRRCNELDHALVVLGQLQGTLDLESGGEVAEDLDRFYNLVRRDLIQSSMEVSPELLIKQRQQILGVREAWLEVELQHHPQAAGKVEPTTASEGDSDHPQGSAQWKA